MRNHRNLPCGLLLVFALTSQPAIVDAQSVGNLDAEALASGRNTVINCDVRRVTTGGRDAVEILPRGNAEQQMLIIPEVAFRTGTITFDFFAAPSSRFIGIAWHVESERAYEAVYFRPFRFRDTDPVGRRHAIQYVSHPDRTWQRLRAEFPDVYESACPVDAGQWVPVRLEVGDRDVRVFAGGIREPLMNIDRPFVRSGAGVALWTGAGTKGAFANLNISPGSPDREAGSQAKPSRQQPRSNLPKSDIPPANGEPVDLLAGMDSKRNALVGEWSRSGEGLEVQPKPFAQIVIPAAFPESFDIDVSFTRKGSGTDSVAVLLPVGEKGVAVQFAARGTDDGIGLINSAPSWAGPATRKTAIVSDRRINVGIRVRRSGAGVKIAQYMDGKPWIYWEGPVDALSLYQAFKIPTGCAGLAAYDSNTVFHQVVMRAVVGN